VDQKRCNIRSFSTLLGIEEFALAKQELNRLTVDLDYNLQIFQTPDRLLATALKGRT